MSAITSDDVARDWARRLETKEASRLGLPLKAARARLADRLGISSGTLENLSRQRIKGVKEALFSRLRSAVIEDLRHEITAHTHELTALLEAGRGPGCREVQEVEAGLKRLRALIDPAAK